MKYADKHSFSLVLFLFLMMSMVQFTAYANVSPNSPLEQIDESRITPAAYVDHESIWVDGNDDFISQAAAEGWQGDGSERNPFIITGHHILTTTTNRSFLVGQTWTPEFCPPKSSTGNDSVGSAQGVNQPYCKVQVESIYTPIVRYRSRVYILLFGNVQLCPTSMQLYATHSRFGIQISSGR